MIKYIGRLGAVLAVTSLLAACGGKSDSARADSALTTDLQMAGGSTAAQPSLGDTAKAPATAPAATVPVKKPATTAKPLPKATAPISTQPTTPMARVATVGEVATGTTLILHPSEKVCTNTHKVGDVVSATVADAVAGSNGVSIPAGAVVQMEITALKRSENVKDPIDMGFKVTSVAFDGHTYEMSATVINEPIERVRNEPTGKDVQKVVGGAIIGAIAGKIIGKSTKGAVVGAATGAAAGAGVAATTANYEGCIAQGSNMTVRLSAPVTIKKN